MQDSTIILDLRFMEFILQKWRLGVPFEGVEEGCMGVYRGFSV